MTDNAIVFTLLETAGRLTRRLDSSLSMIKGISFSEYQILAALRDHPNAAATRVDLSAKVGLSPSGVTRALKPMEKLGFVETTPDARDARKSLATLSPTGVELVTDADGVIRDTLSTIDGLQTMTKADQSTLADLLGRFS